MFNGSGGDHSLLSELLAMLEGSKLQYLLIRVNEDAESVRSKFLRSFGEIATPEDIAFELPVWHDELLYESGTIEVRIIFKHLFVEGKWLVLLNAELNELVCLNSLLLNLFEFGENILSVALDRLIVFERSLTLLDVHSIK